MSVGCSRLLSWALDEGDVSALGDTRVVFIGSEERTRQTK
jgi:hypothetical protein